MAVAAVVAYQRIYAERIFPGIATADGLYLGSLTRGEASAALGQHFNPYLERPLTLRYRDQEWIVPAATLGVRLDADGVLDAAYRIGREGSVPQRLADQLEALRFGRAVDMPLFVLDDQQAVRYFTQLAAEIDRPVIDARLVLDGDLQVRVTPAQVGRMLDTKLVLRTLGAALSTPSPGPVELPVVETPPARTETALESARAVMTKMLSSPLTLQFEQRTWTLSRQEIAGLLPVADWSKSAPEDLAKLDEDGLLSFARRLGTEIDQQPLKPRLAFESGQLHVIREGRPGYKLDAPATVEVIKAHIITDDRRVPLPVQVTLPAGIAEDRLAIRELVSSATTNYAGGLAERRFNVELAAAKLNGTVVGPGEVFSFNEELGPMTLQAGFKWGWGITQAQGQVVTVPSVGGGICQVSTTLFQAIFWAGYQIEKRNWHRYWIERYGQPPTGLKGLDATVDQVYDARGNLVYAADLQFKNTTPYPILIEAKTDGARLTFKLYSTKPNWQVSVDPPLIEDVVKADPTVVREVDPSLPPGREIWIEAAQDGFKSTIVRTVRESGKQPRVLRLVSTYKPSRNVVRVGPPVGQTSAPAIAPTPDVNPIVPGEQPAESVQAR